MAALLVRWGADVAAADMWQHRTPLWLASNGGHHATALLLLAVCDGEGLWRANTDGWTPLARCMSVSAIGSTGKIAIIAKALLATPGFMTPLPRVIAAVQQAEAWANKYSEVGATLTPAHPLVLRAIAQQANWLRRRTLLLLRMLTDKGRATWRCRCTDCLRRRKGRGAGARGVVSVQRQQVAHRMGSKAMYVRAVVVVALGAVLRDSAVLYRRFGCRVAHAVARVILGCVRPLLTPRLPCSGLPVLQSPPTPRVCV